MNKEQATDTELWQQFAQHEQLSEKQLEQYKTYAALVQERNKEFNLTALTELADIIPFHFQDSLALAQFVDFADVAMIADVGAGAGFPGIPLKIKFPHIKLVLIEVNQKKVAFLHEVVDKLGLADVQVFAIDWRAFLRKTDLPIDMFLARASVQPEHLINIFKPTCPYNKAQLIYWASRHWQPSKVVKPYIAEEASYQIGPKQRRYIFLKQVQEADDKNGCD